MISKISRNKNSCHLLEFKYILEDQTAKPWLFEIDSDIKFCSFDSVDDNVAGDSNAVKNSRYVAQYKDTMMTCLLHKVISKIEKRLHEIKFEEFGKKKNNRFNMLYDLSKLQKDPKSESPARRNYFLEKKSEFAQSLDKVIENVIEGDDFNSAKKKFILSNVLTEIHKSLNETKTSALNVEPDKVTIEKSKSGVLKFPQMKSPRRRGFIVDKNISKKLKLKLPIKSPKTINSPKKSDPALRYVRKGFEMTRDPVKKLINMDNEITKILNKNRQNSKFQNENKLKYYEKAYTAFNEAFKSLKRLRKCNLDEFIDSTSYFNMSQEEIVSLFHAIQKPDEFKSVFDALGLSETKFKMLKRSPFLMKSEKDIVIKELLEICLELDKTPELPDIHEGMNIESIQTLISPKFPFGAGKAKITGFKNIYEDPRKDPRYKYQSSPFKTPRNEIEKNYEEFLENIKVKNEEEPNLRSFKPKVAQSLPKLQTVNKAFRPYYFGANTDQVVSDKKIEFKEDNHERALRNWAKVKTIMKLTRLTGQRGMMTHKLKSIAKQGQLKEVIEKTNATIQEKQAEIENIRFENMIKLSKKRSLCVLLPFSADTKYNIGELWKCNMEDQYEFIEGINIMELVIKAITAHKFHCPS